MLDEHIAPEHFGIMPYINILNIHIPSYAFFMVLAFVAAFICFKLTSSDNNNETRRYRSLIVIFAFLGGIVGAKLPIVIYNYKLLFSYPENINLIFTGKTIIGGLIGGFLAVVILKKSLGIKIKTGNDIAAPVVLAMAIGRIGCFLSGCCYGIESPGALGINFGDGIYRYPTQLYEIFFDLSLFAIFLYMKKTRELKPGILFRYLINSYLVFRFFLEFVRESDRIFGISYYQIICLVCLVFINRRSIPEYARRLFRKENPNLNANKGEL